jgi:iron complex outermembrane recepter protein
MLKRTVASRIAVGTAVALGLLATDYVCAQESTLAEVVVTARKREENLQEVTTAVSALGVKDLANRFDTDLRSFANAAPNVQIDDLQQGPGSPAAIAIRGVGTTDVEKSFDPANGVVVDGLFIGVNSGAMVKALDIESIEVLRGPQGTLFGRNAIGGIINITRAPPSTEAAGGSVRLGYGNYNDLQVDGYVNVPFTDSFAFKLGAAERKRDGYYYDPTAKSKVGEQDYRSVSPGFLWKATKALQISYRYDKTTQDQDTDIQINLAQPNQVWCFFYKQCAKSLTTPQSGDRYVTLSNDAPKPAFFNTEMHNLHAAWDVAPGYKVDYVFGYFKTDEDAYQDWDGTPLTLYSTLRPATYYQHSHELRLTYSGSGPLSYTVGLYGWNSAYRIDLTSFIGFLDFLTAGAVPAGTVATVKQTVQQKTDSQAAFFEGDYKFADNWTLTVGGRYTKDKKTSGLIDPSMPQLAVVGNINNPFEDSWTKFTPKLSLKYRINPDLMVYGLYSKGFRAGGYDGRPNTYDAASKPYNPETVDNYELGWKAEFLNRRLRLNGALFVMKYKDKQEEESILCGSACGTGQETLVVNAASATIKGLELDFAASVYGGFTVNGNVGILQAKYDSLKDPVSGTNLSSLHLRRSPPVTATVTPAYEWALGKGTASLQASYHYIGSEELTFFNSPQGRNSHQSIVDASINYAIDHTRVSVYGMNLTNEDAWTQAYDVGAAVGFGGLWTYATPRAPRTYGLRITQGF